MNDYEKRVNSYTERALKSPIAIYEVAQELGGLEIAANYTGHSFIGASDKYRYMTAIAKKIIPASIDYEIIGTAADCVLVIKNA